MRNKLRDILEFDDLNNRALFIHVPKTGGGSMGTAPFILVHASPNQPPTSEFIMNLPFRFSFVRDPYQRIASAILNLGWATPETFTDFVKALPEKFETGLTTAKEQQLWTMTHYLIFNGKLEVDFLGRFENLKKDWKTVCKMIRFNHELPHVNKSGHKHNYDKFYTPETRQIIRDLYSEDFDNFGYKM